MTQRRQNTNLSDASQESSIDSQLNTSSMAAQPSRSPRPMTRLGLEQALANAAEGITADDLARPVNEKGDRVFDHLVSGMPTANDPDASSPPSSRPPSREHNAAVTKRRATHARSSKRGLDEINGLETAESSRSQRAKKVRLERDIERVDECFGTNGGPSGTSVEDHHTQNKDEDGNYENDDADTNKQQTRGKGSDADNEPAGNDSQDSHSQSSDSPS